MIRNVTTRAATNPRRKVSRTSRARWRAAGCQVADLRELCHGVRRLSRILSVAELAERVTGLPRMLHPPMGTGLALAPASRESWRNRGSAEIRHTRDALLAWAEYYPAARSAMCFATPS
jgi:hypothetical protein